MEKINLKNFLQEQKLYSKRETGPYYEVSAIQASSSGPGCSKLTRSLVNVSLKFQTIISNIRQDFLLKKCEKLLHCKSFSHFFSKKYQCIW